MMRYVISLVMVMMLASPSFGQLTNLKQKIQSQLNQAQEQHNEQIKQAENGQSPRQTQPKGKAEEQGLSGWIERKTSDGVKVRLYYSHPNYQNFGATPNLPALVVVQEWWGVNDDIKRRADEFAGKGYYALAVDLYDGKVTDKPAEAAELKKKLTDAAALLRLKTGVTYLFEQVRAKNVNAEKIGVIGWCMGGTQALNLAAHDPRVKAVAVYYAGDILSYKDMFENIKGPVAGVFGNEDKNPSPADVNTFESLLKQAKVPLEIYRFENVGHAFASPSAAGVGLYKPETAKEADAKVSAWLEEKLRKTEGK